MDAADDAPLRLRPEAIDRLVQRRAILGFLHEIAPRLRGTVLDVGCGHQPYRSLVEGAGACYIGLDLPPTIYRTPDLVWDGVHLGVRDGSVDAVLVTEVLEHVPDPMPLLSEVVRALRPGGRMYLTVPYLWPLHDVPDDMYRYTPFALERVLRLAGLDDVELKATGGWDASLAQLLGLWARRRPMRATLRRPVSWLATPVVGMLARVDRPPSAFGESTMITGIAGWATKPSETRRAPDPVRR